MSALLSLKRLATAPQFSRTVVNKAALRPAPQPRGNIPDSPEAFLKAIGRSADSKITAETWEELWKLDGHRLKAAGVEVKDRRYLMWCMEKFRQGMDPKDFAHEPKPKKKIRGWGPAVQFGKRIRSRRDQ
ncbi:IGR protein motif-domain-containing protein [Phanerochaete sordida]|uniref:Small ribosomal subunit protein mS41 n=1 Tax=Phanerochaete sordida TaxID=48140 RepID=A0A9P3LAL1_9APHY|nr:IGR protein motif-domain-containing protein [Phanerochaete sordida]